MLKASLEKAELDGAARRSAAGITVHGAAPGLYVQFESRPGVTLNVSSLEDRKVGIEVVAVTREAVGEGEYGPSVERATVFVPDGQVKHFVSKFEAYASTTPKAKGDHRHEDMLDRVSDLRLATLRALWTDSPAAYPADDLTVWWEVWLRRTDGRELERLHEFAVHANLNVGPRRLEFDDRIVVLVRAAPRALAACIDVLNDFAELRATKELASFFVDIDAVEQAAWSDDLLRRVRPPSTDIAVCVLDTGVTRGHPLLAPAIAEGDVYAINPEWGAADDGGGPGNAGHGTEMAGLALYGDLAAALASSAAVHLTHRVESVKILPPKRFGSNDPEMYGTITALGVSYPEAATANRRRVFSLAVTATDERDRGQPTSWSAAIDALAAGRMFDQTKQGLVYLDDDSSHSRLFVVSAGNVEVLEPAHLDRSDTEPVHDPAHAWNALTVGAYTERAELDDSMQPSWTAVARPGDLSPWSTTSVTFGTGWPIKPDVVAEGGNVAEDGHGSVTFGIASLSLLTTYCKPAEKPFVLTWATSAAAAQVARLCAMVSAEYPTHWPETVRALVVHSAVNLGIAVDIHFEGLIVPVIQRAETKSLRQLARETHDIAERARTKQLSLDDIAGGTFTISNAGPFGTTLTAPIINQPQVAIMSTDGIHKKPVVVESHLGDSIAIHRVGMQALCFDHRANDGAYTAAFLRRYQEIIETRDWATELA